MCCCLIGTCLSIQPPELTGDSLHIVILLPVSNQYNYTLMYSIYWCPKIVILSTYAIY